MTERAITGLSPMLPRDCDVARMKRDLCGIKPFTIPSSSMSPNIEESELVAAQILEYSPISRGDIIVHKAQFYDAGETIAITRVVGLPGETVEMRDGHVRINGATLANVATGQTVTSDSFSGNIYTETTPEGRRYSILMSSDPSSGVIRDFGPVTLPEDSYFVLGDNRDNSMDSRYPQYFNGDGFVKRANIIGVSVSVLASRNPERIGKQLR
ncbi:signal peptidase I [Rhizobium sp. P38BS-XIX]|uniref:signal peptidase I n=1 Tax=Rhizobium sp. P38BS-XIX TaxID=2726740 RepID=UPI00145678EF|nr:signal peptidase I [Rhizobium sp. P38BS-XIX]NLS00910.1 signal peptidase I [Rhizobium sp. P38BS-XIX]